MPTEVGNYTYDYADGDLTVATLVAKPRKIYPVDGDSTIFFIEEDYMQFIDYYEPLAPNSVHQTLPNVFYNKDTPIQDVGNGIGRFTRSWVLLPGYDSTGNKTSFATIEYGSTVWTVPGMTNTVTGSMLWNNVNSGVVSGENHVMVTAATHDIAVGDWVTVHYRWNDPVSKEQIGGSELRKALAGTSGTTVVVQKLIGTNTVTILAVHKVSVSQPPRQETVGCKIVKDYWLPGVNPPTFEAIPIIQAFSIIEAATGGKSEYLSATSAPTLSEYQTAMAAGQWLCAESSVLRRWMNSNIIERSTMYVRYML
jgi:hypothetical protein